MPYAGAPITAEELLGSIQQGFPLATAQEVDEALKLLVTQHKILQLATGYQRTEVRRRGSRLELRKRISAELRPEPRSGADIHEVMVQLGLVKPHERMVTYKELARLTDTGVCVRHSRGVYGLAGADAPRRTA
tara:strand:+ start:5004 stop:5402 length:399 start_codon:yes stop_codon:yes gene_type:complete